MVNYYEKYLKYKNKYLKLVNNIYGGSSNSSSSNNSMYGKIIIRNLIDKPQYTEFNTSLVNYLNNYELNNVLDSCITKFITYNTLEQNMATLFNGRSITTFPEYQELNKMFIITDTTTNMTVALSYVINNIFEKYRSPPNLNNDEKNLTRNFYNTNIITNITDEIKTLLKKAHTPKDEPEIDDTIIDTFYTFNDLIEKLRELIIAQKNTFIINTYQIQYNTYYNSNLDIVNYFNNIIDRLRNANEIIINSSNRLSLVLGRILYTITLNSIVAVEEISQCLFTKFYYNLAYATLLEHINIKTNNKYCCIINPDHNINHKSYNDYLNDNIQYWGGSSLFIPCNYFNDIILKYNTYYVLTTLDKKKLSTRNVENYNDYCKCTFIFNPYFNKWLSFNIINTTGEKDYKDQKNINKTAISKRTIIQIYNTKTNVWYLTKMNKYINIYAYSFIYLFINNYFIKDKFIKIL